MHPEAAKKLTHCLRGHELAGHNVYLQVESRITKRYGRRVYFLRSCRKCRNKRTQRWRAANLERCRESERRRWRQRRAR